MMRRKLGILILAGVTVLAGTQEAMRQFDGLRSSLSELTRASLWSGLIVYAQPVADGKLPAPQIYYLMPPPPQQTSPAAPQAAVLADNSAAAAAVVKPETQNNHVAEELAAAAEVVASAEALPPAREIEDAAKSELVLDEAASHMIASRLAAVPKVERVRVYEEVARNAQGARKFKQDAELIAKVFVKEFDPAKLEAEIARLAAVREQLETSKLKSFADAENLTRRLELRMRRPAPRPERPERHERIKVIVAPYADRRAIALPEISSIGCEKTMSALESATAVEATVAVAGLLTNVATSMRIASESAIAVEPALPAVAAPLMTSTNWALGCDTEPEYSK